MGHIRLGRLPKTKIWQEVAELLDREPQDLPGMASAILAAGETHLERRATLAAVGHAFGILVGLAQAADRGDLIVRLQQLGVHATADTPLLTVLAELGDRARATGKAGIESGHAQDIAGLALRRALMDTVGEQGSSLFESTALQLEEGFRRWSGGEQFGRLTRLFFGDFTARVMQSAVDRELSNHVTLEGSFGDAGEAREFGDALDRYARETAAIVQRFATDWYAKHHWQKRETISARQATGFASVALAKLRSDLTFARENA